MTLTFKDPNGREWELRAHRVDYGDSRFAEPADLIAALGQLSTGRDGPTGEKLSVLYHQSGRVSVSPHTSGFCPEVGFRALFAAGSASRQAEVDRLTAELADEKCHSRNQRGELNRFNRQVRADYEAMPLRHQLESELTATRAKLAEVERERDEYARMLERRGETVALAEEVRSIAERTGQALASAGTDADRTEAERRCFACGDRLMTMWFAPEFCDEQCATDYDSVNDEEPKPEPRCTYWRPGWERRCGLATDGADLCPAHLMLSTRKFGLNVRPEETNVDIPRRDRIDQMTPAELAIRAAVEAVERVGAHPLLTDAVNLLHEAQGRVADYVDTTEEPKPEPQPSGELRRGPASGKVGE